MEKEQVIKKLEEVFVTACDWYVKGNGESITEIRELGETIIKARTNIGQEVDKAKGYIHSVTHNYLVKNELIPTDKDGSD